LEAGSITAKRAAGDGGAYLFNWANGYSSAAGWVNARGVIASSERIIRDRPHLRGRSRSGDFCGVRTSDNNQGNRRDFPYFMRFIN